MSKKFEKLNEVFNVASETISSELDKVDEDIKSLSESDKKSEKVEKTDVEKDYEYVRGNLYSLLEKNQEALNGILELAQESGMPRAYEVTGQLIKTTGEIADKILLVHKILKDVEEDKPKGPTTVNNALFVGSTAELAKLLKQKPEDENV
jgi:hypothetical protein